MGKKSKQNNHLLQIWLPDTIGIPLREAARRAERSYSAEVRYALKQHLRLETGEAADPDQGGGSATRRQARDDYSISG